MCSVETCTAAQRPLPDTRGVPGARAYARACVCASSGQIDVEIQAWNSSKWHELANRPSLSGWTRSIWSVPILELEGVTPLGSDNGGYDHTYFVNLMTDNLLQSLTTGRTICLPI